VTHALFWSGGKDSWLALTRARRRGITVTTLVNLYDEPTGRVRFHAVHHELIAAQAFALGLRLHQHPVPPDGYETAFRAALARLVETGHTGAVFGNIHLADVRAWFEERVTAAGLAHVEPLWGEPSAALLDAFVTAGATAIVTCVATDRLPAAWLGRPVDEALATDLARHPEVDPCGERGEYHTFVYAGPGFAEPVAWRPGPIREAEGFATLELLVR
jgi:uncharacterized protein (TIGR00290 family)